MFVWGFGQGLAWYGVNSLELHKIDTEDREYYTSKLGLYSKVLSVTVPIVLTVCFYFFSDYTYLLIFVFSGICTLVAYYFSKNIIDFIPPTITKREIKKFLIGESAFHVHSYTLLDGMSQTLEMMLPPVAAYLILGTEVNVGIYTEIASIISIALLYAGIKYRKKRSKQSVYMLVTLFYVPFMLLLAFYPLLYPFIIFSAATLIFGPQLDVSKHNVDLFTMSLGQSGEKDFYSNMVLREFTLFFGRVLSGAGFLWVLSFMQENLHMVSTGFVFLVVILIFRAYAGYVLLKKFG
jgi:hypothetical protein